MLIVAINQCKMKKTFPMLNDDFDNEYYAVVYTPTSDEKEA